MVVFGLLVLLLFLLTVTIWARKYEKEKYRQWTVMNTGTISIQVGEKVHATAISQQTYNRVRDGLMLKNKMMSWFWAEVIKTYGDLTEENIIKYMDEKWVL